MRKNKVNQSKYESLECRNCLECKNIIETENPGFNYWNSTGRIYLIVCSDGMTRACEVGDAKPSDCLVWERNMDKWDKSNGL